VQGVTREGSGPDSPALAGSTLQYLQGDWSLTRHIADHRARRTGTFAGLAIFRPLPGPAGCGRLAYREQGEFTFGAHRGPAWRELTLVGTPGGAADVLFADGRAFYRLDLRAGHWRAEHPCSDDRYLVTVSVLSAGSFTESWQARGPEKDYDMTATYTRTGRQA
jgi:Family of unknown function (DUF6314)